MAAGEVFAEHGFRAATVRDICQRAGSNVAAVNYHFRDKEHLYAAVLEYAHGYAIEKHPPLLGLAADAPAEQRLQAFVRSFLLRILDEGRPAWHGKLMAHEFAEPTSALDKVVEQSVRPLFNLLVSIIRELAGPDAPNECVRLCAASVVGQCLHFYHARPVIARLNPAVSYSPAGLTALADHVARFSLAAIRGFFRQEGGA